MSNRHIKPQAISFAIFILSLFITFTDVRAFQYGAEDIDIVPGEFIVRFTENGDERDDPTIFEMFYNDLASKNINPQPKLNISSDIFTATSLKFLEAVDLTTIQGFRNVKKIWPVRSHFVPQSIGDIEVPTSYSLIKRGASFKQTGVEALHTEGIMGEGVIVAVLDTGIDHMHTALGGGIGKGYKVGYGKDFSGEKGSSKDHDGHGTHIAGIIAGNDPKIGFVGVAPMATLHSYRLCRRVNALNIGEDAVVAAALLAYRNKADIISISIDGRNGWEESALAVAFEEIAKKGVFISATAGNTGLGGPFNAGSAASGTHVTTVGSIESPDYFTWEAEVTIESRTEKIPLTSMNGLALQAVPPSPVVALPSNPGSNGNECLPQTELNPRLSELVVLVQRGGPCSSQMQLDNLIAQGARNILFYNNDEPYFSPRFKMLPSVQYTMTTAEVGEWIVNELAKKKQVRIETFSKAYTGVPLANQLKGGLMRVDSGWGPTNNFRIKPEIAAPGGSILSTYPISKGSYATLSGTSMATPFIAGVAALYIGVHKKLGLPYDAMKLRDRIITSGNAIPWYDGKTTDKSINAPVAQAGGGYIDAWKVVKYKTSVSPGKIELGPSKSSNFLARHEVTIVNNGESLSNYRIVHSPDAGFLSLKYDVDMQKFPPELSRQIKADLVFEPAMITIGPKGSASIVLYFTPPTTGSDDKFFPVYSGRVHVIGSNEEMLSVPYLGVVGDPRRLTVVDPRDVFTDMKYSSPMVENRVFSLTENDHPAIDIFLVWGSPEIKIELVRPGWSHDQWRYKPDFITGNYLGRIPTPIKWYARSTDRPFRYKLGRDILSSNDLTANDEIKISNGEYRLVLSVLKPSGERGMSSHWDIVTSPIFTVTIPDDGKEDAGSPLQQ